MNTKEMLYEGDSMSLQEITLAAIGYRHDNVFVEYAGCGTHQIVLYTVRPESVDEEKARVRAEIASLEHYLQELPV